MRKLFAIMAVAATLSGAIASPIAAQPYGYHHQHWRHWHGHRWSHWSHRCHWRHGHRVCWR